MNQFGQHSLKSLQNNIFIKPAYERYLTIFTFAKKDNIYFARSYTKKQLLKRYTFYIFFGNPQCRSSTKSACGLKFSC